MGWVAESLGLDYLRVQSCRCKGQPCALMLDTEIGNEDASTSNLSETGDEDASTSNWTERREDCMNVTNTLRRRFLQVGSEDSVRSLSIPKTPLRLW
jgi:hypothetical protein